jgi:hypothetical protein
MGAPLMPRHAAGPTSVRRGRRSPTGTSAFWTAPALRVRSPEPDSVTGVSSYRVSVGGKTVRVKNFRDARSVVVGAITDLLKQDPEPVARVAMATNQVLESGAAEYSLIAHSSWSTTVTVHGEPVELAIIKKRWW